MDFSQFPARRSPGALLSPRDIFTALPERAPGYGYLRDVQGQVLDLWEARRTERDLSVKMNTGSGKTIVGLLILQSCLNEGISPALYVAPNTYLTEQVTQQAARLGIAVTDDVESARYLSGQAIGTVNIHKLMNGRSVFGGPGSSRGVPIPIGSLVVDDAHAALATTEAQATIVLQAGHPARDRLFEMFRTDLRRQSESAVMDIDVGEPSALVAVPFWAWANRTTEVRQVLSEYRDDDELRFALPLIGDTLSFSTAVFTSSALEVRPPFPPVGRVRSFDDAARRVYLTATLPDDTVLVGDFGASSASISRPITPSSAADIGDRLIIAPQEINTTIGDEAIRQSMRTFADSVNVVVLVPSFRRAEHWVNVADVTAAADDIAAVTRRLQSEHVGLVVLVNKYDGIDLPEDACRILVLDGLPEAYGALERLQAVALGRGGPMAARQIQRIEQGMGRGVRSAEDYCVIVLVGRRLLQLIADPRYAADLSPATSAQLQLSKEVADHLDGRGLGELEDLIRQVLRRDASWVALSRSRVAGVTYGPARVQADVVRGRQAFDLAAAGQFAAAVLEMRTAADLIDDPKAKGWALQMVATYQQQIDSAAAQQTLQGAIGLNRQLTKPLQGIPFRRLTATDTQARVAAGFLSRTYTDPTALTIGVNALLESLVFDPDRTDDFEQAMEELGEHLGFAAQRPDKESGSGPDVLWAAGANRYFVIECKSGSTATQISRHDAGQLGQSLAWFDAQYGPGNQRTPWLIHPSQVIANNATSPEDMRVVDDERLTRLLEAVRRMNVALANRNAFGDPDIVAEQLRANHLTAGDVGSSYSAAPRSSRRS